MGVKDANDTVTPPEIDGQVYYPSEMTAYLEGLLAAQALTSGSGRSPWRNAG
jgi:hypothetical protein